MKPFYTLCNAFFWILFKICYRLEVLGIENLPKGSALLAANHVSFWDPPLVGVACPEEIHYLARASLFQAPIVGTAIRHLNAHPVAGTAGDLGSLKLICKLLQEGDKVLIFPESIRTWDGKLQPIKSGAGMIAMRTGAPIVPVLIEGAFKVWPRMNQFPKPWGKIRVTFGKAIDPKEFAGEDKKVAQQAISVRLKEELSALRERG